MISEGSRDTENRRNDAENSALHHRNKLHFKIYIKHILKYKQFNKLQYLLFFIIK